MVQLCRIPSEFDVAPMRDSFLRQFLEQGTDVTTAVSGGSVTAKDIPVLQPGAAGKTDNVAVLSSMQPKSLSSALARHLAVAEIVRCVPMSLHQHYGLVATSSRWLC